ncbi:Hsp70 family protein [Gordonia sp. OPL2]|uniref:Hsp70 family protein n=1 Tax=Gordonia sp. OPL2 TaxID=2486274 RepID=UPI001654D344|nr:Hsp70 family protein [Gordonia sp. OPL2]ROZ99287.1 hypothetical protein EEB19_11255 [Gordonia sp. OPL2]
MTLGIGVTIGADNCVASAASADAWETTVRRSTVELVGRDDFIDRVGDPVGIVDDNGDPVPAADVYAEAVDAMVDAVRADLGDLSDARLTVLHPDTWSAAAVDEARDALHGCDGLTGLTIGWAATSSAAVAAAEHSHGAFPDGATLVAYDLGASTLTATVVRAGEVPEIVGRPLASSAISGREFDRLILADLLDVTGVSGGLATIAHDDPSVIDDLAELRERCRAAKETLSVDTDAVVDVAVGEHHTEARLVREDAENLLRAPILESASLIREALIAADVTPDQVTAIVATGGGASIPLVTELLSTTLRLPVLLDPEPLSAAAAGAALLATRGVAEPATDLLPVGAGATESTAVLPAQPPVREVIPAPSLTADEPAPRLGRGRRGMLIGAGTLVLAAITATGLSVGTGLIGPAADPVTPAPAGAATSERPLTTAGTTGATTATGTTAGAAPVQTQRPVGTPQGAPTNQAPVNQNPVAPNSRAQAPATQNPSPANPGSQSPAPANPAPANPAPSNPGSSNPPAPSTNNPPPEFPESSGGGGNGGGNGGGGNGGGSGGGVTQLPGRVLEGTGDTVCGVAGILCR